MAERASLRPWSEPSSDDLPQRVRKRLRGRFFSVRRGTLPAVAEDSASRIRTIDSPRPGGPRPIARRYGPLATEGRRFPVPLNAPWTPAQRLVVNRRGHPHPLLRSIHQESVIFQGFPRHFLSPPGPVDRGVYAVAPTRLVGPPDRRDPVGASGPGETSGWKWNETRVAQWSGRISSRFDFSAGRLTTGSNPSRFRSPRLQSRNSLGGTQCSSDRRS